jgi:hypothetical protein
MMRMWDIASKRFWTSRTSVGMEETYSSSWGERVFRSSQRSFWDWIHFSRSSRPFWSLGGRSDHRVMDVIEGCGLRVSYKVGRRLVRELGLLLWLLLGGLKPASGKGLLLLLLAEYRSLLRLLLWLLLETSPEEPSLLLLGLLLLLLLLAEESSSARTPPKRTLLSKSTESPDPPCALSQSPSKSGSLSKCRCARLILSESTLIATRSQPSSSLLLLLLLLWLSKSTCALTSPESPESRGLLLLLLRLAKGRCCSCCGR